MAEVTEAVIVKPNLRERLKAAALFAATPQAITPLVLLTGIGLAVAGVYVLAGVGWALIAGSAPLLLLAAVLIRGLLRVG
jgi:hypothetical protein